MFDAVRNNKTLVQIFLALITLPFALWGVESYVRNSAGGDDVASVGGSKVSAQELQRALRDQEERMRASLGPNFNPAMFDNPEVRRAVLDSVVNQRLLGMQVRKAGLRLSDETLGAIIQGVPQFQDNGKFSRSLYDAYVAGQGQSQPEFEARLRQDILQQQLLAPVRDGSIVARSGADRWLAALQEEREVSEAAVRPEQFAAQVKLGEDAVKSYYDAQRSRFEIPERLRVEYVLLSEENMAAQAAVSEEEVRKWYQARAESYKQGEERRASHILIKAGKDAPAAEVTAAQAKAEDLLAQARKNPADFAKLAKQNSQDPGSAEKGGDLGWFSRGMMVKPFEEAAYALKENEISGLVRSDFGFHVIKLTGTKGERVKPLEEVRADIVADLKRQAVAKKYAEMAEPFSNTVYEQADSLKPAAEKFKLTVQSSDWIVKGAPAPAPFNNPKLLAAIFSDDAVKNKRNTEAVEVAPKVLVAARVLEHKAPELRPLDSVRKEVEEHLKREEAAKLARASGEATLARLEKGEKPELNWVPVRAVTRLGTPGMAPDALRAIFRADPGKLPAYAGLAQPGGSYVFYRVSQVKPHAAVKADDPRTQQLRQQYARVLMEEEFSAWMNALRLRYPVEVNAKALGAKPQ